MNDEERYEAKRLQWWKDWAVKIGLPEEMAASLMRLSDSVDDDIFNDIHKLQ